MLSPTVLLMYLVKMVEEERTVVFVVRFEIDWV